MVTQFALSSLVIANVDVQAVQLHPILGGYEIWLPVSFDTDAPRENAKPRWARIFSARVSLAKQGHNPREVGTAFLDQPVVIDQAQRSFPQLVLFKLPLQPYQLSILEEYRNGGDFQVELILSMTGGEAGRAYGTPEQQTIKKTVPQSDWVAQLNGAKALNIVIVEIPIPMVDPSHEQSAIFRHIAHARKHLVEGNFKECVAECRQLAEEIGGQDLGAVKGMLCTDKESMGKQERVRAILWALQHFTHLAAHSASRGGIADYTRSDASLILSLASALTAYHMHAT